MTIYQEEIFGPVLAVVRVDSLDAAVKLINQHAYGNGTAIFTRNGGAAREFAIASRWAWWASMCRFRCRWPSTALAAGKPRCLATITCTARKGCVFTPA
jgi:hypothetical protein